jgi:hypothetical protein
MPHTWGVATTVEPNIREALERRLGELRAAEREVETLLAMTGGDELPGRGEPSSEQAAATLDSTGLVPASRPFRRGIRSERQGSDGRAPYGSNRARIMEVIAAHPGITTQEIVEQTEIKSSNVRVTIYRMKSRGELEEFGEGLRVSTRRLTS